MYSVLESAPYPTDLEYTEINWNYSWTDNASSLSVYPKIYIRKKIMWVTISLKYNDVIIYELTKMDYVCMLNSIKILGERRIVTELNAEPPTYPIKDQV